LPRTLKLTLAYDGTEFSGWQRQADKRTVQAVIEDTLAPIEKRSVVVTGAGRTDAGVHAAGQVASVTLERAIADDDLHRALNATLPGDVRVIAIEEASLDFNARHDARRKTYHYAIWNGASVPPFLRHYVLHVPQQLDLTAMNDAAFEIAGEHDFASFQAAGSDVKSTVRRVLSSTVREVDVGFFGAAASGDRLLQYEVTGTGFLRHMVRNIAGTLIECGRRRSAAAGVRDVLDARDRSRAGATAPAHGLTLWKVEY
jgi:tRNA pseudouridine38-40 synthase